MSSSAPNAPLYSERSRPSVWWWPAGLFVIASIVIAYGSMLGRTAGALVAIAGLGLLAGVQALMSWRITLTDRSLTVGRETVPADRITGGEALTPEQARHLAGPGADARAHLRLRGGRPAVRIDLDDPSCPYWLVSTPQPDALATAISGLIARRGA